MFEVPFLKRLVLLNGLVPLAILAWDAWFDRLGANSVNYAIHITGILALLFLVLSLLVTPLKAISGWQTLVAYRRALGLYGFFYAVVHLVLYIGLDRAGDVSSTIEEFTTRRYLQVGLLSLILMVPLAVTSTDAMIRRLGPKRWKLLHRLAYVAVTLGGIHYLMLVKSDIRQPVAFLGAIGVLLVGRLGTRFLDKKRRSPIAKPSSLVRSKSTSTTSPARFWKGKLKLARIFRETHDVQTFRFVAIDGGHLPFDYQPGQYLNLKLPIDGRIVPRSYTIASSPTRRDYCEITVKREPHGLGSRFIHDSWCEGDEIEIGAPAGKFTFDGRDVSEVVLIGGGVGITPVMSMLRYLTDRGWPGSIHFVLVIRSEADFIFADELKYLRQRHTNLRLHVTLTRPERAIADHDFIESGRLTTERLTAWIPNLSTLSAYLCGPDAMMDNTRQLLIAAGVAGEKIYTEAFSSPTVSSQDSNNDAMAVSQSSVEAAPGIGTASHRLTITGTDEAFEIESGETLLEGAERCGIEIPFECRSGVCGQCKVRLCRGDVHMDQAYALSSKERAQGWILACQSQLKNDVEIKLS